MGTTIAVIPCYNEAKCITGIVREALTYVDKVIVVDNNSTDGTRYEALRAGAYIEDSPVRGVGATTRMGISAALRQGASYILTLDGDNQHDPTEIPKLLEPLWAGEADIVIGSRFVARNGNTPSYRRLGIEIINLAYNWRWPRIADSQSGFRAFTAGVAEKCSITEDKFAFATEFLVKARKAGFRIMEVPVRCVYHQELDDNSSMNPVVHGVSALVGTIKWRLRERS